ncbi:substrate-binding periplasmic protein [Alteromonas sediminis]|uniref:substrate-binding periplasmic protein n=1 Tax=Alteromonas sediminis TaxID=2259342 RepID=UPI0014055D9E
MMTRVVLTLLCVILPFQLKAERYIFFGVGEETYEIQLLKMALEVEAENDVTLDMFNGHIPKYRAFQIMDKGEGIDIVIGGATKERTAVSQPVHFPIFKGLYGLRLNLINKHSPDILKNIRHIDQLKTLIAGQFHTWSDTKILRHNGLTVASGSDVNGLYEMLHKGRYDFFPRSALEIQWDLSQHQNLDLIIDPHIVILYPKAHYYYVQKGNDALAKKISKGLETLLKRGEYDRLFNRHFGQLLQSLTLNNRHVLHLDNPSLPDGTPLDRPELWYSLKR